MQYIADSDGYVKEVSFGGLIECGGDTCTEYAGAVPTGYDTIEAWYLGEAERLHQWKIVDGQLVKDAAAPAPVVCELPIIIETGSSGKWTYRKWSDGWLECWGTFGTDRLSCSTNWGSVYTGTWMATAANKSGRRYPIPFVEAPMVTASPVANGAANFWLASNYENDSGNDGDGNAMSALTHAPAYQCVRGTSATIPSPAIHYYATGRWK